MKKLSVITGLTLVAILMFTISVQAKTPDGQTPAEETVCENEVGAAFGLCNAYCEAMDCDSDNPNANDIACQRVGDKFIQLTGQDLPCEGDECFDANVYASMGLDSFKASCDVKAECAFPLGCSTAIMPPCEQCSSTGENCDLCNNLLEVFFGCQNVC